jgi:hypothetical protein
VEGWGGRHVKRKTFALLAYMGRFFAYRLLISSSTDNLLSSMKWLGTAQPWKFVASTLEAPNTLIFELFKKLSWKVLFRGNKIV